MGNSKWALIRTSIPSIGKVRDAIQEYGPLGLVLHSPKWLFSKCLDLWHEFIFDFRYRVDTSRIINVSELDFQNKEIQKYAVRYRPIPPYQLERALKTLKHYSIDFSESTFIDYGCGAGRAMITAAEAGFKRVIGIELSPRLVRLCQSNVERYLNTKKRGALMTVLEQDAAEYIPPEQASVFLFYVPFSLEIYHKVIENIRHSVQNHLRAVYLLDMWSEFDFLARDYQFITRVAAIDIYRLDLAAAPSAE